MSIKNNIVITGMIGVLLGMSSCKKFLDVNKNPNVAQNATVQTLLPSGQIYLASAMGVDMEIDGSIWAQFWTQSPGASQYRRFEQYQPTSADFEAPWDNFYAGSGAGANSGAGETFYQLYKLAASQNKKQYMAISLLMRAYMFQVVTDAWGDIPFSEALRGLPADGGIYNPHYDLQQAVYNGILAYIDSANTLINPSDPGAPGSDDLIYGGNMTQWQKFSNTLKLRVLMRLSKVNASMAQTGIQALYATNPAFLGAGDDAQINFTSAAGNKNPLFSENTSLGGTQNVVASATCVDSMLSNNDQRITVFYEGDTTSYVGIPQGAYNTSLPFISIPSFNVAGDAVSNASATAPVKFLTGYESLFLQAEAAARGWGTGNDDTLFMEGIMASFMDYAAAFAANGIDAGTAASNYIASANWAQYPIGGSIEQKVRYIITQKWFSMCGNEGFEAWTEWRRTGYPDFFVQSNAAPGLPFPRRFVYPNSEVTTNQNYPGTKAVSDKVWWDVR